jgi:hypothetical protein
MEFGYFTLSDNHYENNNRDSNLCVPKTRFDVDAGNGRGKLAA